MDDKVSIIVPVYNMELFLEKCVASILNQSYLNIEIILVDDGSTDSSGIICDRFSLTDRRVKVVHKKNGGISEARNVGIELSSGKFLAFVDADDYIEPQMIEILLARAKKDNAEIVVCGFKYDDSLTGEHHTSISPITDETITGKDILIHRFFESPSTQIYWSAAWNKLYKKSLFDNDLFPAGYNLEDLYLIPVLYDKCNKVACVSSLLYNYVQQANSVLHATYRHILDGPAVYFYLSDFFSNREEYASIYLHTMHTAMAGYRRAFWDEKNNLKKYHDYDNKKRQSIKSFRSAWKKGRKKIGSLKDRCYFEMFFISFGFARFVLWIKNTIKKRS